MGRASTIDAVTTRQELDRLTYPAILRPWRLAAQRLTEKPWCPKCFKRTSYKAIQELGMCPSCERRWHAFTVEEVVEFLLASRPSAVDRCCELWVEYARSDKVAAAMRREHPIQGYEWDTRLVHAVLARFHDEWMRRRKRGWKKQIAAWRKR